MDSIKPTLALLLLAFPNFGVLSGFISSLAAVMAFIFWAARIRREINEFHEGSFWKFIKSIFKNYEFKNKK